MELYSPDWGSSVAHSHEYTVLCPGDFFELLRERVGSQRMIAHYREWGGQSIEYPFTSMLDSGYTPVHGLGRMGYFAPEELTYPLVAQAHSERGQPPLTDYIGARSKISMPVWPAGPGRYHHVVEIIPAERGQLDIVAGDDGRNTIHFRE
jgi:hypothetical protein